MNGIQLIAMDMDGTLLDDRQQISAANLLALHRAAEAGLHIAFCSGRMAGDASAYAVDANLPACHILAINGACALERPNGPLLWKDCLTTAALDAIVRVLLDEGVLFACFEPNRVAALPCEALSEQEYRVLGTPRRTPGAPIFEAGMAAYRAARERGVCKVVCIEENETLLQRVGERLAAIPDIDRTASWRNNWELMPVGVSKGAAVRRLAETLGLKADQVMTIGDYSNDLSMIQYAGHGVAMGNACDEVKRAARYITDTNLNSGVAKAIERYALQ